MIRLPDAQEWHIQHATEFGALGVVIPTVDESTERRRRRPSGPAILRSRAVVRARARHGASGA
jgi:2-keto-3-deoxy-L-rhamnonate aldolase RhmA